MQTLACLFIPSCFAPNFSKSFPEEGFPTYTPEGKVKIEPISIEEAYTRIAEREFEIDTILGKTQDQNNIEHPEKPKITLDWLSDLKLRTIAFDGNKDLTRTILEDLVE